MRSYRIHLRTVYEEEGWVLADNEEEARTMVRELYPVVEKQNRVDWEIIDVIAEREWNPFKDTERKKDE